VGKLRKWFRNWIDKQIEMSFQRTANRMNRMNDLERQKAIAYWAKKKYKE